MEWPFLKTVEVGNRVIEIGTTSPGTRGKASAFLVEYETRQYLRPDGFATIRASASFLGEFEKTLVLFPIKSLELDPPESAKLAC